MTTTPSLQDRAGFSTRDLLVVAAIGVATVVVIVPVTYVTLAIETTMPVAVMWTFGIWLVPAYLAIGLTRRPGAGLLAMLVVGLVQAPFVPFGWAAVVFQLGLGIPVELVFALTRYRRFGSVIHAVSGALVGLVFLPLAWVPYDLGSLAPGIQIVAVASQIVSGLVFALAGWWLAGRLRRAGVAAL